MRLSFALTALGVLAATALLDLGSFHRFQNADSLIPVLSSLHRWTFYYWEQNRYGMLTPLLAAPVTDPIGNLLMQNALTIAAGFAAFPLAARFFGVARPGTVGLLAAALFVAAAPAHLQFIYLSTVNVFAVSLALGFAGFAAAGSPSLPWAARWGLALGCMVVGSWVNSALGLILGPLGLLVPLAQNWRRWPHALGLAATCAVGLAAAMVLQKLAPYPNTHVALPPASAWPALLAECARALRDDVGVLPWAALAGGCLVAAVGQLASRSLRPEARRGLVVAAAVLLGVAAYAVAMTVLFKGRWRYAVPALTLGHVAAVAAALRPWAATWTDRREGWRAAAAALALVAAVGLRWGVPDAAGPGPALREQFNSGVPEVVAAECTHVAGDFWRVWPAMVAANLAYRDAGVPTTLYAVSFRSGPTRPEIEAVPRDRVRVACFADDPEAEKYRAAFHLPLVLRERRGAVEIWVPAPVTW